ncbi:MAG: WecB/TagA/CpsF family glycosyltransferase [Streptosporangiales bacterium]|nr:WecB/TagA/CpsF family glycosyltransferase [Streptosporangiales bacterium]
MSPVPVTFRRLPLLHLSGEACVDTARDVAVRDVVGVRELISTALPLEPSAPPAPPLSPYPCVDVLGVRVSAIDLDRLLADIGDALDGRRRLRVTFANPNYLVAAHDDAGLRERINAFDHVLSDGHGVMLAARMLGRRIPRRLANDDIVEPLFAELARREARVFLLGSAPGVAAAAADRVTASFPGLRIAGHTYGYRTPGEGLDRQYTPAAFERMRAEIARAKPDFLVVSIPTPYQQRFVVDYLDGLDVPVVMTGGAWIDHLAERLQYYPSWVVRLGLCWAYRWVQEPRRLTNRYTVELADFGRRVLRQRRARRAADQGH